MSPPACLHEDPTLNVLTKAFVVVVTILSVVLVALVVPFAARVPDYAEQYEQKEQELKTQIALSQETATKVRNAIAAKGSELDTALESISTLTAELDRANNDNKTLQTQLDQARVVVARSSAGLEVASRMNESQASQVTQQAELIQKQIAALGELQGQNAELAQVLIDTKMDVRRLSDNYLRIQEENKALSQQLLESQASLKAALTKLEAFADASPDTGPVIPQEGLTIRGSVTKIDQPTEGITFVQVNIGTRDQVKPGMEFTVHRGDEFIGKIQIASVDTAESVGQLTLGGGIKEGDAVRAGGR